MARDALQARIFEQRREIKRLQWMLSFIAPAGSTAVENAAMLAAAQVRAHADICLSDGKPWHSSTAAAKSTKDLDSLIRFRHANRARHNVGKMALQEEEAKNEASGQADHGLEWVKDRPLPKDASVVTCMDLERQLLAQAAAKDKKAYCVQEASDPDTTLREIWDTPWKPPPPKNMVVAVIPTSYSFVPILTERYIVVEAHSGQGDNQESTQTTMARAALGHGSMESVAAAAEAVMAAMPGGTDAMALLDGQRRVGLTCTMERVAATAHPSLTESCPAAPAAPEEEAEELEEVPAQEKQGDPLMGAKLRRTVDGTAFDAVVEDIERGQVTGERLYRIRYTDGDAEHLTALQCLECCLPDPLQADKVVPMAR